MARELGLPFPGGPYLDREAEEGDPEFLDFTHPKIDGGRFDFSFSGMKTRALQALNSSRLPDGSVPPTIVRNISASLRAAVVRDLLWNVPMLLRETKARGFAVCGEWRPTACLGQRLREWPGRQAFRCTSLPGNSVPTTAP